MKKLIKKSLPLMMAGLMFMSSVLPTFATVNDIQTITTPSTGVTEVYYNQESTFGITIPKLIDLGADKETNYIVSITGDISSDETILVVPDESFLMKDQNTAFPKDDVEAIVTQDKTEWKFNEFETIGNGNVSALDLTAGIWEGKFYFNVKLQDCKITVEAKNEAGEDINASATYITGSEKDALLDSLVDTGYINSVDDVDALINVDSDDFDGIADTTFNVSDIAEEGDEVAILHFDEEKQIWEYIGTETVDENGLISGDFTSYSPVAFVKVDKNGNYTTQILDAGLYDENDNMIYSWDELLSNNILAMDGTAVYCENDDLLVGKLVIAEGVTDIGNDTMSGTMQSDGLTEVYMPNTVTSINYRAFLYCENLRKVNLPSSLTYMTDSAFYGCPKLAEVNIEYGCTVIGSLAFYACTSSGYSLKNITIPGSVVRIGTSAFRMQPLTTVIIEDGVKIIGERAFDTCTKLNKVIIPSSVTNIENYAFLSCTSLNIIYYEGTEEQWNTITKGTRWNDNNATIVFNYTE